MEPDMAKPDTTDLRPNILVIPLTDAAGVKFWKNEIFQEQSIALAHKVIDKIAADRDRLAKERDEAKAIIRDTLWMAQRYAHGRRSYAVGMYNDAARRAFEHKFVEPDRDSTGWALDGTKQADYASLGKEENAEALKNFNALAVAEAALSAAVYRAEKAESDRDHIAKERDEAIRSLEQCREGRRIIATGAFDAGILTAISIGELEDAKADLSAAIARAEKAEVELDDAAEQIHLLRGCLSADAQLLSAAIARAERAEAERDEARRLLGALT